MLKIKANNKQTPPKLLLVGDPEEQRNFERRYCKYIEGAQIVKIRSEKDLKRRHRKTCLLVEITPSSLISKVPHLRKISAEELARKVMRVVERKKNMDNIMVNYYGTDKRQSLNEAV